MASDRKAIAVVIMGVSGAGKSTIGEMLGKALNCSFIDADDFHPQSNKEKMKKGIPLSDEDRTPWLEVLRDVLNANLVSGKTVILGCSALQRKYRDILRSADPHEPCVVKFVLLDVGVNLLMDRVQKRAAEGKHFMPVELLQSQIDLLQVDESEGIFKIDCSRTYTVYYQNIPWRRICEVSMKELCKCPRRSNQEITQAFNQDNQGQEVIDFGDYEVFEPVEEQGNEGDHFGIHDVQVELVEEPRINLECMMTAKNAAASVKETAANIGASAKSGMEKTKATLQEKGEIMTAHNPTEKEIATEKKEARINQAEYEKRVAREQNATQRQATEAGGTHSYSTTGATGHPMGSNQMSALPGHGTGVPAGNVVEGVVGSHPIGRETGTGTTLAGQNTKTGGGAGGYSTGGAYR
ncbi:hypothetical protein L1987_41181 [Smallanthus sonchifolius]|uniref:Uncharacterized protein n=1 Tax=Smallanthus sonchifolius TaxID=185202 RepID=A0ACB9GUB0_9ASTR|nr:hypothetical protein L1987_41181 [Smallanthus sonchifolius]